MEVEVEAMQHAEALLLEGELDEVELGRHLAVLERLAVDVLYLRLDHLLDGQVLFLPAVRLVGLAVHR